MSESRRAFLLQGISLAAAPFGQLADTAYRFGGGELDYRFGGDQSEPEIIATASDRKIRILYFGAPWCGHCVQVVRQTFPKLKKVGWDIGPEATAHIQTLKPGTTDHKLGTIPAFLLIDGETEVKRMIGFRTANEIAEWFNSHVRPKRTPRAAFVSSPYDRPAWTTGGENLARHLERVHRYSQSQIKGLSRPQMIALHSRAHNTPGFGYNPRKSVRRAG